MSGLKIRMRLIVFPNRLALASVLGPFRVHCITLQYISEHLYGCAVHFIVHLSTVLDQLEVKTKTKTPNTIKCGPTAASVCVAIYVVPSDLSRT